MKAPRSLLRRSAFAAALLTATALSGFAAWQIAPAFADAAPAQAAGTRIAPINVGHPAAQMLPNFADLVQRVRPAVVTITDTMQQPAAEQSSFQSSSPQNGMPGQFSGIPGLGMPGQSQNQTVHALGSGFLIDAKGDIVTNDHVVKNATDIHVTLSDGRELPAKVVGQDARTDLAVLKVTSATPFAHLALGNSSTARVGDWVVAVGNPFGLDGTVTAGILSARGRQIGDGPYDNFLQIDAPINHGNSGGPLFAQNGKVIGVNTAIYSPSGGSVGIGFAIPSNMVKRVVAQIEEHGKVERGWLGVSAQTLTPTLAAALDMAKPDGALVADVTSDSPAAKAGLQPGDVITAVDGEPVKDPRDLAIIVANVHPGSETPVVVRRGGTDKTLTVDIAQLGGQNGTRLASAHAEHGSGFGLSLAPLNDQAREALNLPADQQGVVVAGVRQNSPAETAGLQTGDVLEAVGNHRVSTPQQAATALHRFDKTGDSVALRIMRNGQNAFVAMQMPKTNAQG